MQFSNRPYSFLQVGFKLYSNDLECFQNLTMSIYYCSHPQSYNYSLSELQDRIRHELIISTSTSNQLQMKAVTQTLGMLQMLPGYIPALLHIIKSNPQDNLVLAILAQLKNVVRSDWERRYMPNKQSRFITNEDRQVLLDDLMVVNIRLAQNYKYSKLMKDIITKVGKQIINAYKQVQMFLQKGIQLRASLNYLLGVVDAHRYCCQKSQVATLNIFLSTFVPLVSKLVENGEARLIEKYDELIELQKTISESGEYNSFVQEYRNQKCYFDEIVYLSIKFMKKVLKIQRISTIREYAFKFAKVAITRLNENNYAYSEQAMVNPEDCGEKGSDKFNYLHGKKWACRYMIVFVRNILVLKRGNESFNKQTQDFMNTHQAKFILQVLHNSLEMPQPRKLKLSQLQLLETMISNRSRSYLREFRKQLCHYQQNLLPRFIHFSFEDMNLAKEQPMRFIHMEIEHSNSSQSIKKLATTIWCEIAQLQFSLYNESNKSNGDWLIQNLQLINSWMKSVQGKWCEMGAFLLIRLSNPINRLISEQYRPIVYVNLQRLLNQYLSKLLNSSNQIFNVRGLELISCYANFYDDDTMSRVKFYILKIIKQEAQRQQRSQGEPSGLWIIKLIKAVIAFCQVFQRQCLSGLAKKEVELILMVLLGLIQKYEYSKLMRVFIRFLEHYHKDIAEHTYELVKMMGEWYRKYLQTDHVLHESGTVKQDIQKIASGCIQTLITFIEVATSKSEIPAKWQAIRQQISNQIISILITLFTQQEVVLEGYAKNAMFLLSSWLYHFFNSKLPLTPEFWFFYRIILLHVRGVTDHDKQMLVQNLPSNSPHLTFINVINEAQSQYYQSYLVALRNYIKYLNPKQSLQKIPVLSKIEDGGNLSFFFSTINDFYMRDSQKHFSHPEYPKGQILASLLLIYLLQFHGKALQFGVCKFIFSIIKINIMASRQRSLMTKYNIQLFSLWIWIFQENAQRLLLEWNHLKLQKLLLDVYPLSSKGFKVLSQSRQITRVVLGLSCYIKFCFANNLNLALMANYIKLALRLINDNFMLKTAYNDSKYEEEESSTEEGQCTYYWQKMPTEANRSYVSNEHTKQQSPVTKDDDQNYVVEFTEDDYKDDLSSSSYESDLSELSRENYCNSTYHANAAKFFQNSLKSIEKCFPETYKCIVSEQLNEIIKDVLMQLDESSQDDSLDREGIFDEQGSN